MAIFCAVSGCGLDKLPPSQKKRASYVSLLCGNGQGRHVHNSEYAHVSCAEDLAMALVGRAGYLPFSYEVVIAYDPAERKISEHRTNAYYYCGRPECLIDLLDKYGSPEIKHFLEEARRDPEIARHSLPLLDERATQQLRSVVESLRHTPSAPQEEHITLWQAEAMQEQMQLYRDLRAAGGDQSAARTGAPATVEQEEAADARQSEVKNVLLVGSGAVGSMLASKLLLGGHQVVIVDMPDRIAAIRSAGLRLREDKQNRNTRPTALLSSLDEAGPLGLEYDLLILATKAYDAPAVLQQLPTAKFPLPRMVMTLQNGIGTEETAARTLGAKRVLAASLTIPVSAESLGNVTIEKSGRGLGLAPVSAGDPVDEWVEFFQKAGIETQAYADYRAMKWSKLFLNIVANATCAILNRKPAVIYGYRKTFDLELAMLKEALAVIKALDLPLLDLPGSPTKTLARGINYLPAALAQKLIKPSIERGRGTKMPSLYLDLAAGNKSNEVVFLNGAVVKYGRQVGVPTPVNFILTDTLHKLAHGVLIWDDFRGKPEALISRVRLALN